MDGKLTFAVSTFILFYNFACFTEWVVKLSWRITNLHVCSKITISTQSNSKKKTFNTETRRDESTVISKLNCYVLWRLQVFKSVTFVILLTSISSLANRDLVKLFKEEIGCDSFSLFETQYPYI